VNEETLMDCDNIRDDRLDVLYGEADTAARRRVEEHLAHCEACREEMAGLKRLRHDLKAWTLPESSGPRFVAPLRSRPWLPMAAGFLLALAAGLLLLGTDARYENGGIALHVGRPDPVLQKALLDAEARALARDQDYRREIDALKAAPPSGPAVHALSKDDQALLLRVAEMLRESESRQEVRLEKTLARLDQKQDAQRRYDMARIAAGLSYLDGKNGQHVARTTELMGYVLEAAQQR
jgi:hypothetical protein